VSDGADIDRSFFVANVRELHWQENELGATCEFDKLGERFPEFGINLTVLQPGQPMTMYHRERYQEGFLILRGECLLIVEGRELQRARSQPLCSRSGTGSDQTQSSIHATTRRCGTERESSTRPRIRKRPIPASRGRRRPFRFATSSYWVKSRRLPRYGKHASVCGAPSPPTTSPFRRDTGPIDDKPCVQAGVVPTSSRSADDVAASSSTAARIAPIHARRKNDAGIRLQDALEVDALPVHRPFHQVVTLLPRNR
jgi:hypothetical protein